MIAALNPVLAPQDDASDSAALGEAIKAHRAARAALDAAGPAADAVAVERAGTDASDAAMAPAQSAWQAAREAEELAFETVLALRPETPADLAAMLRYVAESPALGELDDPATAMRHAARAAEAVAAGAPTPRAVLPPTDPVLALIEEHRAAYAAWAPLSETWGGLPLADPAYAAAEEAQRGPGGRERSALSALTTARPTTLAGVLALAEYLPGAIRQVAIDAEGEGERALRTIAAALRDIVLPASVPAHDPVLAAIAASRKAQAEMEAFLAETRDQPSFGPSDRARETVLSDAQITADMTVWRTVPTTQAGRRALVEYVRFQAQVRTNPEGYVDNAKDLLEEVLGAMTAAIDAERPAAAPAHADAPLFGLGAEFIAAWRDEEEAFARADCPEAAEAAYVEVSRLGERIARAPATTPEGYGIKALALARLESETVSPADPGPEPHVVPVYSDAHLLWQINIGVRCLTERRRPAPAGDAPAAADGGA